MKSVIKGYHLTLNKEKINNELALCGTVAIFTTDMTISAEECLYSYRLKDQCEKAFANIKNDIINERMMVHSTEAWHGKLFVVFIGLILRLYMQSKLRPWIKEHRKSLNYCFELLSTIKCRQYRQDFVMDNALTRSQRDVVQALQLPINFLQNTIKQ